eukprot:8792262-Karenia_brevis.AAC.1
MNESDIADQVDQSKWEKLQEKIKKRSAEQNAEERPAQQARTRQAQGEKRAAEATPDDEMTTPHKTWRIDDNLNNVVGKDWQILKEIMHLQSPDVVEIYSPPRVTQHANQHNLKP